MQVPFAIAPRAEPGAALHAALAKQYWLGAVHHARDIGGTYNLNLQLHTTRGEYVVRVHRPWVTGERLALLHLIRSELAAKQLPVPLPLRTSGGATMIEHRGRLVEVEPFVGHDSVADTWECYVAGFAMLSRLHQALLPFSAQLKATPPLVSNYGTLEQLTAWTSNTREQVQRIAPTAANALAVCDAALALLRTLQAAALCMSPLPPAPTHGDYGGDNLLFRQAQIAAIVDWDFTGVRPRVFDLAYSLYWMFHRLQPHALPEHWQWQTVPHMLAAYNAAAWQPLTADELHTLPLVMAQVPLYWIAEAGWLADPMQAVLHWADQVPYAQWLVEHATEVAPSG